MADRPILFSAPMIRAILDGRKTQTRRAFRVQPRPIDLSSEQQEDVELRGLNVGKLPDGRFIVTKPRFTVGDRLWVRETWRPISDALGPSHSTAALIQWEADQARLWMPIPEQDQNRKTTTMLGKRVDGRDPRWVPSIHQFRWASRITLHVTAVKVERLSAISDEDVIAEGLEMFGGGERGDDGVWHRLVHGAVPGTEHEGYLAPDGFRALWESINGAGSWAADPWVAAISFRPVLANIDSAEARAA